MYGRNLPHGCADQSISWAWRIAEQKVIKVKWHNDWPCSLLHAISALAFPFHFYMSGNWGHVSILLYLCFVERKCLLWYLAKLEVFFLGIGITYKPLIVSYSEIWSRYISLMIFFAIFSVVQFWTIRLYKLTGRSPILMLASTFFFEAGT
jgi:hypothetical protein